MIGSALTERSEQMGSRGGDLVDRLVGRDPRALAEVHERFGSACFGFLLRMLGDRHTAEDVQQQVFLEVWQRAPTFDPERAGLLTWIMTIARSRAIDQLRRRVPEPAGSLATEAGVVSGEAEADRLVEHWHFVGLLSQLPRDEAMILRLRFYDDLTQVKIAEHTGIPLGTVKARMVSGLGRLRELIEER